MLSLSKWHYKLIPCWITWCDKDNRAKVFRGTPSKAVYTLLPSAKWVDVLQCHGPTESLRCGEQQRCCTFVLWFALARQRLVIVGASGGKTVLLQPLVLHGIFCTAHHKYIHVRNTTPWQPPLSPHAVIAGPNLLLEWVKANVMPLMCASSVTRLQQPRRCMFSSVHRYGKKVD